MRGPVAPVTISLAASAAKALAAKGQTPASAQGLAMFDTGATSTCIDEEVAAQLKLPTIDIGKITSASHAEHPCNIHPVQLVFPQFGLNVEVPRAAGLNLKSQGLAALIGRDFLSRCTLFYNGVDGSITLSF